MKKSKSIMMIAVAALIFMLTACSDNAESRYEATVAERDAAYATYEKASSPVENEDIPIGITANEVRVHEDNQAIAESKDSESIKNNVSRETLSPSDEALARNEALETMPTNTPEDELYMWEDSGELMHPEVPTQIEAEAETAATLEEMMANAHVLQWTANFGTRDSILTTMEYEDGSTDVILEFWELGTEFPRYVMTGTIPDSANPITGERELVWHSYDVVKLNEDGTSETLPCEAIMSYPCSTVKVVTLGEALYGEGVIVGDPVADETPVICINDAENRLWNKIQYGIIPPNGALTDLNWNEILELCNFEWITFKPYIPEP